MRTIGTITENIGGIPFGMGLFLFFYLFWKSRYIPRILSGLGLFTLAIWIAMYLASLLFPEHRGLFMLVCYPPGGIALVVTGFWLAVLSVKTSSDRFGQPA
ncbi:MAG TPA: DUF4386 family protein [Chloroflexota bacterium]